MAFLEKENMGVEVKLIKSYMKKGTIVLGVGVCLYFLYRFLPSFFVYRFLPSVVNSLASSLPVIFCTALLLGALLTFGQPNGPAQGEKRPPVVSSVRTRRCTSGILAVEKTARPILETHAENRTKIDEKATKRDTSEEDQKEINGEKKVIKVEKKEFHNDIEGHSTGNQMQEIEGQHISDHNVSSSSSDSDSESSSSDTPMIAVMPVLDELHPLIESVAPPLPTLVPQEDSDVHESDDGSADLVGEVENAEEEEEAREKAVVKWTEDDEKNLKEVGSLEIERNQRLENLIAKRMARKRWMIEAEKNLIDFDANDGMPINIPSVSTIRLNPFDPPYDLDEIVGLPVPGSAPSVLLPRLNPFETPYDRAFERSNVVGEDPSQEEFTAPQQKDMFFRRYESFTLGAPFLGEMKQEKHDFKYRPYFIPENVASGVLGYGTTFQRQSSERSDSKVSSIPETDTPTASVSSIIDSEDQKDLLEQDFHNVDESNYVSNNSPRVETDIQSSKETDSDETNSDTSVVSGKTPQASGDVEETQNADAFDGIKVNTGNGGQEIVDNGEIVETPQDADAFDAMTVNAGNGRDEVVGNSKIVEGPQDSDKFDGMKVNTGNGREEVVNNSKIVETPADTDAYNGVKEKNVIGREATVNNGEVEAPVYDSSPSAIENLASISENLFDVHQGTRNSTEAHAENSEEGLPPKPTLVERSLLHEDTESISNDGNEEKDMASNNEVVIQATPSSLSGVDEKESESRGDGEISGHDTTVQVGLIPEVVRQPSRDNTLPDMTSLVSKTDEDEKVIHQDMHVGGPEFNTSKASGEGNHEESQDPTSAQSNTVEKTNVDNAKSELDVSS